MGCHKKSIIGNIDIIEVEKPHFYVCFFLFQSLVEKHFPAPDRDKINRILGIGKQKTILDELGKKTLSLFIIIFRNIFLWIFTSLLFVPM